MSPLLETFANASARGFEVFGPAGASNSYELITSSVLSSTGTFSFTSIPQTYTHFQLRFSLRDSEATTNGVLRMRFNNDAGSNYEWNFFVNSGSGGGSTQFGPYSGYTIPGNNANPQWYSSGVIDVINATSTTLHKAVSGRWGGIVNTSTYGYPGYLGAVYKSTSAVNRIDLYTNGSGFLTKSRVSLYGIKGVA
jgi:hypothetical protein